jgi:Transposase DDE domain
MKVVVLKQLNDFEISKNGVSYRSRWLVEGVFSSIKRIFEDHVSARKFPNMIKEIMIKASLYNMFIDMK